MRIVFMGTPEFAVPVLRGLADAGHEIVAVVTAPDRPAGRGRKLKSSAIVEAALKMDLPLLQPLKLRDPDFLASLKKLHADLAVVVAFRMLPKSVWSLPRLGTLNLHASLLPDYRGAAPINWVLINGEEKTGLTTFFIDEKIDTGDLLLQRELQIQPDWNAGDLHDEMARLGADLVVETVAGLATGTLQPSPQDPSLAIHSASKIFREDCQIDWSLASDKIHRLIRGLSPYPGAWTRVNGKQWKIFDAGPGEEISDAATGDILISGDRMSIACADRWLEILELQPEGKKRMKAADYIRGIQNPDLRAE